MTYERQLELTADRLRQLPASRLISAQEQVYSVLEMMTDRPVPQLRPVGWADQLLVIGREVPVGRRESLGRLLLELRRGFDVTL